MSAGNSADKPQFVKNQMLTHDSLNNLVEFSAGRTQRVMKALGLGGTVSGVSWSFDKQKKIINITPGFIIFPDGEVVEIANPITFNDIGTDGVLKYETTPSNPTNTAPSHLCVSYEWATDGHRGECFSTASDPYKVKLKWKQHIPLSGGGFGVSPKLFQPLLLPATGPYLSFIHNSLNQQIAMYNFIVSELNKRSFLAYGLERIPPVKSDATAIGIYGDISFELAYFAKRLMTAAMGLLRNRDQNAADLSDNTVSLGVANNACQYLPAEIDSLLFEVFLCHKVVSDSITTVISDINRGTTAKPWTENRPQGVYARWKNTSVCGVFLNTTAQVLAKYCDTVDTTSDGDFNYLPPLTPLALVPKELNKPNLVQTAANQLISSFLHVSNPLTCLVEEIIPTSNTYPVIGFIKPYRE